jgi:hypothetical protein
MAPDVGVDDEQVDRVGSDVDDTEAHVSTLPVAVCRPAGVA